LTFSQNILPKIVNIDSNSIAVLVPLQYIKGANISFVKLDECRDYIVSLEKRVIQGDSITNYQSNTIRKQAEIIKKDSVEDGDNKAIYVRELNARVIYQNLYTKTNRKFTYLKRLNNIFIPIIVGVLAWEFLKK
jgi:hypothetical protein